MTPRPSDDAVSARSRRGPTTTLRRDLAHLEHLIDQLHRVRAPQGIEDRELVLLSGKVSAHGAEQRLRAVGTLLATLDAYQRSRDRDAPDATGRGRASTSAPTVAPASSETAVGSHPEPELAAAAARYIARDLAARHLTEFTSAEAYRLARALARIGGASAEVERSLAEASTIRLHPAPLSDAVSHSAV